MIRTWKTLALYSLIAMAPVAAQTPVAAGSTADDKLAKRIDDLITLMNDAVKAINTASKGMDGVKLASVAVHTDVDRLKTRIDDLEKLIKNLHAEVAYIGKKIPENSTAADRASLDELRKQLASIEQTILRLRVPESPTRIALSPPAPTGRVILANMYHEEMLFIINDKTHRVLPGAVLPLESVPAGSVRYEVLSPTWGMRARSTTNLPANETFTLTAR